MAFSGPALQAFTRSLKVGVSTNEELAKKQLAAAVKQERARVFREARRRSQWNPTSNQIIDGQRDAPLSAIKPSSRIIIEWWYLAEVAEEVTQMILDASPDGPTGQYDAKMAIFIGNNETLGTLADIKEDTRSVTIGSTVIYSRRLEVGKDDKGGPFVVQAPYEFIKETGILASRYYKDIADVRLTSFQLPSTGNQTYPALRILLQR